MQLYDIFRLNYNLMTPYFVIHEIKFVVKGKYSVFQNLTDCLETHNVRLQVR